MQQRCILGTLSWAVSVIRDSKYEASDVFPDPGSNIRHPLSVLPSLHRVLRDQFPGFIGNMKVLRLPAARLAALRFLRLAILGATRYMFAPWRTSEPPRPGVGNPVSPAGNCRGAKVGLSQVLEESQLSVCKCSNPTPAGLLTPDHYGAAAWPLVIERQRLPRLGLSTLNSTAFGLAVYASQGWLPNTTQDSLPVAGQALLDGLSTRKVPMKGFRAAIYISSSFPRLAWRNRCDLRAQVGP